LRRGRRAERREREREGKEREREGGSVRRSTIVVAIKCRAVAQQREDGVERE